MLYTGRHFHYPGEGARIISISRGNRRYTGETLYALAPTWEMLKMSLEDYIPRYEQIMRSPEGVKAIYRLLIMGDNEDVIILCWCTNLKVCHRRMLALHIEKVYGRVVPEWGAKPDLQKDLFG